MRKELWVYMLGRNHIIANVATLAILAETHERFGHILPTFLSNSVVVDYFKYKGNSMFDLVLYCSFAGILYVLGSLLPDIDSPNSLLGRYIHIPTAHRGITHTVWFLLIVSLTLFEPIFFWFVLGTFFHLFWDSCSRAGVCWFYPISGYREYANGARVKRNKKYWLYRTGKPSEYVVVTILVMAAVLTILLDVFQTFQH